MSTFNIPIIYFLILLISKEVFSYDSEKVVILCILTFVITAYYQIRVSLADSFNSKRTKLEEEFTNLSILEIKLNKNLKNFWSTFFQLEKNLIEIFLWVKYNLSIFIIKANKNKLMFSFHISKDQLNYILKDKLTLLFNLKVLKFDVTKYVYKVISENNTSISILPEFNNTYYALIKNKLSWHVKL